MQLVRLAYCKSVSADILVSYNDLAARYVKQKRGDKLAKIL